MNFLLYILCGRYVHFSVVEVFIFSGQAVHFRRSNCSFYSGIFNNLSGAANDVCTACAYIDGEYMGAFTFDENGLATLALNTTGLEKGEHLYKVIFKSGNNSTIERLMRFRVGDSAK